MSDFWISVGGMSILNKNAKICKKICVCYFFFVILRGFSKNNNKTYITMEENNELIKNDHIIPVKIDEEMKSS